MIITVEERKTVENLDHKLKLSKLRMFRMQWQKNNTNIFTYIYSTSTQR